MTPVLQVDKEEWEAFLSEFSKLTRNCELIISKLELAQAEIRELNQENEILRRAGVVPLATSQGAAEPVKSEPEVFKQAESEKPVEAELRSKPRRGFWDSLRLQLSTLPRSPQYPPASYASCRRCGYQIKKASRFCSGCGVDFGAFICPCSRDVSRGDRYCDRCGRQVGLD